MSICGNCHYNWHSDEECNYDCTCEDAVYREQMAYDSLRESFDDIVDKYNKLIEWCQSGGYQLPFFLEPYTKEESKERDALPPMLWTRRDWQAYYEEHKAAIESLETIGNTITKIDLANSSQAEEAGNALKKICDKLTNNVAQAVEAFCEVGEVYPITTEELAAANKIAEEKNNDN